MFKGAACNLPEILDRAVNAPRIALIAEHWLSQRKAPPRPLANTQMDTELSPAAPEPPVTEKIPCPA